LSTVTEFIVQAGVRACTGGCAAAVVGVVLFVSWVAETLAKVLAGFLSYDDGDAIVFGSFGWTHVDYSGGNA
jgi:hypothetical protein